MRTKTIYFFSLFLTITMMTGCFHISSGPKPSKSKMTKKYSVTPFNKIENKAPANIVFTQGNATKVEADGPDNYIPQLIVMVKDSTLSISMDKDKFKNFFRQKEVPAHLLRYKQLFAYQDVEKEKGLGDDFDTRILTRIERPVVKAQRLTMRTRFMPLFKAAAMIAVLFLMGTVMQHAMEGGDSDTVSVHDEYQDSTTDPQVAYEPVLPTDTVTKITADDTGTGTGKTN